MISYNTSPSSVFGSGDLPNAVVSFKTGRMFGNLSSYCDPLDRSVSAGSFISLPALKIFDYPSTLLDTEVFSIFMTLFSSLTRVP